MKQAFIDKKFTAASLAIIERANQVLTSYAGQGYDLSLRQLFYQFVSRDWLPNTAQSYNNLGALISNARLAGLIDWNMIRDRGRYVVSNTHWSSPADILEASAAQFRYDLWEDQDAYIEVMVEKAALEGVLIPVCREVDVRFTANRGYCSQSTMYEAGLRYKRQAKKGKDCYVLYLGDHDPSGIDMTRDVDDRLQMFLTHWGVEVKRLALNMDQIEEYEPPPNYAKETDSRHASYVEQYGSDSWELDALEPTVLADLVRNAVIDLRDDDLWTAAVARQSHARAALKTVAQKWDEVEGALEIEDGEDEDYDDPDDD